MLSLEQCRKIDPSLKELSDEELLQVCDDLYGLGKLALDNFARVMRKNEGSKNPQRVLRD